VAAGIVTYYVNIVHLSRYTIVAYATAAVCPQYSNAIPSDPIARASGNRDTGKREFFPSFVA